MMEGEEQLKAGSISFRQESSSFNWYLPNMSVSPYLHLQAEIPTPTQQEESLC